MTELSPAAQAVLDAASEVYWDWGDMVPSASHTIAAAALRAAADQLTFEDSLAGDVINPGELLALADELESQ